jgi:hypothetical protein
MNSKSLLVCLLILALVASTVQGLTIKPQHNLKARKHMVNQFVNFLNHKMDETINPGNDFSNFDGNGDDSSFDDTNVDYDYDQNTGNDADSGSSSNADLPKGSFSSDLLGFALGDSEVWGSMMNKSPLSDGAAQRLKEFIKSNEAFNNDMVTKFSGDGSDGCLSRLSDSQKRKLVGIIIDHMDMQNIVGASKESKDVTSDPEFLNDIMNDKDLGSSVLNCYDQDENTEDDDQNTNTEDDGQDQ